MSKTVTVSNKTFELLSYANDETDATFCIPTTEDYAEVKRAFVSGPNEIVVKNGGEIENTFTGYTKLTQILDDTVTYAVDMEKEYDDSISLRILTTMAPSIYEAQVLREKIEAVASEISDEEAIEDVWMFPEWCYPTMYKTGDRVQYTGKLYKCIQAHTSQADWTPSVAVSLWVEISDPSVEWPDWKQPTGAHDAYATGDKVSHNDKHWISSVNANVWEPGVYGWNEAE